MKIIFLSDVQDKTGLKTSAIYNLEKKGEFPSRRKIGMRRVGWLEGEIDDWLNTREKVVLGQAGFGGKKKEEDSE